MIQRRLLPIVIGVLFTAVSCSRQEKPQEERLLLLPIENQTGDAGQDWLSGLSSAVLEYDLGNRPHLLAFRGDSIENAVPAQANRVLQGNFTESSGVLSLHLTLENPARNKTLRLIRQAGPASAGIVPLLDAVARDLGGSGRQFPTRDQAALRSYAEALDSPDPGARVRLLQTAADQDPKFSVAALALGETLLSQGDRPHAAEVATTGAQNAQTSVDKAQLRYLAATARDDLDGREKALREWIAAAGPSRDALRALAQVHTMQRNYGPAIQDYEAILRLDPHDSESYNQAGYLHAYRLDLEGARTNLRRYAELAAPDDPNPADSLGEVHYFLGDFEAAERYFMEAQAKNPASRGGVELLKAAEARLLTGDLPGADGIFAKYLDFNKAAGLESLTLQRAQWEFVTGRRKQGMSRLEGLLDSTAQDTGALAGSQLSIWHLQTGDRAGAAKLAEQAGARASTPSTRNLSMLCQAISASPPNVSPVPFVNAIGLVMAHRDTEAIPLLRTALDRTLQANDAEIRTLLAAAYVQSGQVQDAKPLVDLYPFPISPSEPVVSSLVFPRFLKVRAAVLAWQNKTAEARRMDQLFQKYAGDLPDQF